MHRITYTRPVPEDAPTRMVDGQAEVFLSHDGKKQWFPLSKGGRARIPSKDWHGRVRLADGRTVTIRLSRNKEASQRMLHKRQMREDNIASGKELPTPVETNKPLAEYVLQFEQERIHQGISRKTQMNTMPRLRRALSEMELATIADLRTLTAEQISKWFINLELAPGTKAKVLETFRQFMRWLADRSLIASLPKFPKTSSQITCKRRALTFEEVERLAKAAPWPRSILYRLAFSTLARRSALMNLLPEDLKFAGSGVTIELRPELAKTKHGQQLPVPRHLAKDLKKLVAECAGGKVFSGARKGNFSRNFDEDLKASKIAKKNAEGVACFHSLRHGGTTHLIRAGVPLVLVQRMGGWQNINILARHYSHLSPISDREHIDRAMNLPAKKSEKP